MSLLTLAWKSIRNRLFSVVLTVVSIALSVLLLVSVERVRHEARESFANTVAGTDLIVGARGGQVQLLLYSIFRMGNATNNISWESYQELRQHRDVAWTVPLSLGDSHRGFRVLGTNGDYFQHYRFGRKQALSFRAGAAFDGVYDAVLGADVARELGYGIGESIVLSHGTGEVSLQEHGDQPFRVVGILAKTGTPVDRTVHIRLQGMEAIHAGWVGGRPTALSRLRRAPDPEALQPKSVTAVLVGLKSPMAVFQLQRYINEYRAEPLLAAMPGVALQELWDTLALVQQALLAISVMVVLVGITGMATAMLAGLNERRREMAVLRSVGARPWHIFVLVQGEALIIMLVSVVLGVSGMYLLHLLLAPWLEQQWGLYLSLRGLSPTECWLLGGALVSGLSVGLVPAYRAYRFSLADGMTVRL
ncbi:ABC transporter permease [Ketobacter sp.]|uniref:ABC transporter permease n=1 Tax=Ketobacter sp. TaxID=2083498 RepID=UPI000F2CF68C|nr:ABC transporter permease [Ketobacter sp.]RLU01929.1 MAG: ABC transporter permease [Ketobacter sp.]